MSVISWLGSKRFCISLYHQTFHLRVGSHAIPPETPSPVKWVTPPTSSWSPDTAIHTVRLPQSSGLLKQIAWHRRGDYMATQAAGRKEASGCTKLHGDTAEDPNTDADGLVEARMPAVLPQAVALPSSVVHMLAAALYVFPAASTFETGGLAGVWYAGGGANSPFGAEACSAASRQNRHHPPTLASQGAGPTSPMTPGNPPPLAKGQPISLPSTPVPRQRRPRGFQRRAERARPSNAANPLLRIPQQQLADVGAGRGQGGSGMLSPLVLNQAVVDAPEPLLRINGGNIKGNARAVETTEEGLEARAFESGGVGGGMSQSEKYSEKVRRARRENGTLKRPSLNGKWAESGSKLMKLLGDGESGGGGGGTSMEMFRTLCVAEAVEFAEKEVRGSAD
ncbi:hypothetical protein B0H14DRAFT_2651389 [Mycena olivaceomarginata]|nr:hypothetical protein B0H14DRAFT_2651389 [Mycena olivaceomarginata]